MTDKQVRKVKRRLLEAAYGASFQMLVETTSLSSHALIDALELCEHEADPAMCVLQLWRNWINGGIGSDYKPFPEYVRLRMAKQP